MIQIKSISVVLALFFMLHVSNTGFSQSAILFQIPSSTNQINVAESSGDTEMAAVYKRSDNQIRTAIMRNFKAEFTYCPVYFFSIDDYDKVKSQNLSEVEFYDLNGKKTKIPEDVTDYKLANISFFPKALFETKDNISGQKILSEEVDNRYGKGIILYDKNFEPLNGKLRFTPCKVFKRGSIFKRNKRYYDFRGAYSLQRKLKKHGWKVKSLQ